MANYYVSVSGNNNNNGLSEEYAWETPSFAAQQVVAGDTIYLMNEIWYNENIVFKNSGTANQPITLTAYDGTPTLDGINNVGNCILLGGNGSKFTTNYINIEGLKILNYKNGIFSRETSYINILNNEIYNTTDSGIHFVDINNSSIKDNHVHDNGWNSVMVQSNYYDVYNILIENNIIHDSSYGGSNHNTLDFFNYEHAASMHNVVVKNNHIYNSPQQLLYFHTGGTGTSFSNFKILNNKMHDSGSGGYVYVNYLIDSVFENNTVYNSGIKTDYNATFDNVTYRNNIVYSSNPGDQQFTLNLGGTPYRTHTSINDNSSLFRVMNGRFIIQDSARTSYKVRGTGIGIDVIYTDGTVFTETGVGEPIYYPTYSNWITNDDRERIITTYPKTARPTSDTATISVNKFDTSLSLGNILVDFVTNTTNENNVMFTVRDLQPNHYYLIKKDGADFTTVLANPSGYIEFSNSEWLLPRIFTIEESSEEPPEEPPIISTVTNLMFSPENITDDMNWSAITTVENKNNFNVENIQIGFYYNETPENIFHIIENITIPALSSIDIETIFGALSAGVYNICCKVIGE